ncbi:hypothetical protein DSD19_19450 [Rhodovulum sp. BSW8]|nr:hypothetical protein DSD19_19450 [Rhodovulum sp. BSW8]
MSPYRGASGHLWVIASQGAGLPSDWNGRLAPSHVFIFHFNRQPCNANISFCTQHTNSSLAQSYAWKTVEIMKRLSESDAKNLAYPDTDFLYAGVRLATMTRPPQTASPKFRIQPRSA